MANTANVTQGKPKIAGAFSIAPAGTALPTDAVTALTEDFKNLGYISKDGLTNSNSSESTDITAWGGDTVLTTDSSKTDTFQATFIESLNPEVLKMVYGDSNVTGADVDAGLTVKANSLDTKAHVYVIDQVLKGDVLKRIVVPNGTVTAVGDISYKDDDAVGYQVTISAAPDNDGNTHYEYLKRKGAEPK
ncbi:phage tail protein [Ileibacterium valens]|uniref:phage tail tube protein n=1 Tax=Ileibacterium valens TaxID=1862668 RepID=UPI0025735DCD|nr:phage tail protein [Ileibacterium valens]